MTRRLSAVSNQLHGPLFPDVFKANLRYQRVPALSQEPMSVRQCVNKRDHDFSLSCSSLSLDDNAISGSIPWQAMAGSPGLSMLSLAKT